MKAVHVLLLLALLIPSSMKAADTVPGYLGVYAREVSGGVQITGFIAGSAAASLAAEGVLSPGDVITKIGATNILKLGDISRARATIPVNKQAKMVLRNGQGEMYHVWVGSPMRLDLLGIKSGGGHYGGPSVLPPAPSSQPPVAPNSGGAAPASAGGTPDVVSRTNSGSSGPDNPQLSKSAANNSSNDTKSKSKSQSPTAASLSAGPSGQQTDVISKGDKGDGGKDEYRDRVAASSVQTP